MNTEQTLQQRLGHPAQQCPHSVKLVLTSTSLIMLEPELSASHFCLLPLKLRSFWWDRNINISRNLQPLSLGLKWVYYLATTASSRFVLRKYSGGPVFLTHDFVLYRIPPYFDSCLCPRSLVASRNVKDWPGDGRSTPNCEGVSSSTTLQHSTCKKSQA